MSNCPDQPVTGGHLTACLWLAENPMKLTVRLAGRSYHIQWTTALSNLQTHIAEQRKALAGKHIVIADARVLTVYRQLIPLLFPEMPVIKIPSGESSKSFSKLSELCETLAGLKADRHTVLWAWGGGVIGDLTGFLAAVYMRGIKYFQVPTTLLSMVDSSVGGKTAVNLKAGKNMAGAFYQPTGVFMHTPFLTTLPEKEIRCGMAEIVKSALLGNKRLFEFLERNAARILAEKDGMLPKLSYESVKIKKKVVEKDETEQNIRAWLNLGHTLAHAIETIGHYKAMTHGEAVAIGLHYAALVSHKKKYLPESQYMRIRNLLQNLRLPAHLPRTGVFQKTLSEKFIEIMKSDKKNKANTIRFVMLNDIGSCRLPEAVEAKELLFFLKEFRELG